MEVLFHVVSIRALKVLEVLIFSVFFAFWVMFCSFGLPMKGLLVFVVPFSEVGLLGTLTKQSKPPQRTKKRPKVPKPGLVFFFFVCFFRVPKPWFQNLFVLFFGG